MKGKIQKPKFCIFINVDWFLLSHFTNYLEKILHNGYHITVITLNTGRCDEIRDKGIDVIEIPLSRGYANILAELKSLIYVYSIIKKVSPDVLELITIKPVIYGGIVARILGIKKVIFYMSGLGTIFTYNNFLGFIKSKLVSYIYKFVMKPNSSSIIVENDDDEEIFKSIIKSAKNRVHLINGVGVDLKMFAPKINKKSNGLRVALASRLLKDKGIYDYLDAVKILKKEWKNTEFLLVGDPDPTNPASLTDEECIQITKQKNVTLMKHNKTMPVFLKDIDLFVLPSYREGFPKVIMEASATGIPVITTNVVGCRSAVIHNKTGLIVPVKNYKLLASAIDKILRSAGLRESLGTNGRIYAEEKFDQNILSKMHINVWEDT
tara:strand:- start:109 stop:1245 length:1137 start_codon:yes stop_codon:yes gene_type:complete